jgi:putative membrane protein
MGMRLSEADHRRVTAAVTAAEAQTDGEIVTIVARRSDEYHDVALLWAMLAALLVLALLAAFPQVIDHAHSWFGDPWGEAPPAGHVLLIAMAAMVASFLAARLALAWLPLRFALTPRSAKARRVRRKALALFRAGAEARTIASTGVLLYLSIDEHRAEIIADSAIHSRVDQGIWGDAMAALISALRDGRPADGMADAVTAIGVVLAEHFPRSAGDTNELPDRLIEL